MRIQDSLLYQDYSYIIKVGRSINEWRDTYKKTLHSAGFYFKGEVDITNNVNMRLKNVTGLNSSVTEEILGVIKTIFTTILRRKLGTVDDGTSLRANPLAGVPADLDDSTHNHFTPNTRDVTLKRQYILKSAGGVVKETTAIRSNSTKFGVPVAGPTLKGLSHRMLAQHFATKVSVSDVAGIRLQGTQNTSIDGELNNLSDFGFKLKSSFTIPSEIWQISNDSFDETLATFDSGSIKFDKA